MWQYTWKQHARKQYACKQHMHKQTTHHQDVQQAGRVPTLRIDSQQQGSMTSSMPMDTYGMQYMQYADAIQAVHVSRRHSSSCDSQQQDVGVSDELHADGHPLTLPAATQKQPVHACKYNTALSQSASTYNSQNHAGSYRRTSYH